MKYTTKLNLKKPDFTDYVSVEDLNENMDILDAAVGEVKEGTTLIPDLQTVDKTLAGAINEVDEKVNNVNTEVGKNTSNIETLDDSLTTHLAEDATTSKKGHVQLSDATNSTSTILAATANAVKKVYDLAFAKYSKPANGIPKTDLDNSVQTSLVKADASIQESMRDKPDGFLGLGPDGTPSIGGAILLGEVVLSDTNPLSSLVIDDCTRYRKVIVTWDDLMASAVSPAIQCRFPELPAITYGPWMGYLISSSMYTTYGAHIGLPVVNTALCGGNIEFTLGDSNISAMVSSSNDTPNSGVVNLSWHVTRSGFKITDKKRFIIESTNPASPIKRGKIKVWGYK